MSSNGSWGSINVTKIDEHGSVLGSTKRTSACVIDYDGDDEENLFGGDRGCCCISCCRRMFRSVCKPASREAHMDKIQRSGGYMINLPCFKFGKGESMHRWDSEGRVSPHMQAFMYAKSETNVVTMMKRGSCGHRSIRCSARSVLACYRCVYCARFVDARGDGKPRVKRQNRRSSRGHAKPLRETGCCGYTELDHVDLDNFLTNMDNVEVTPMIVETTYHFMPFPYSQTISRGYGSFVCQSKLWEICLMGLYGVLIGLHIRELLWYKRVNLNATTYDNHLEASIFYSQLRVILLGLLSTLTLFEFMVWISKVYRTTAVLFMVVEEMFNRVFKFLVLMLFSILAFMMLRYSIFGMELGIHGLGDYFYSPFKELNGENTLDEVSKSGNNVDIENAIDTVFILFMVLLMANLLIAFMADGYGELTTSGYARYAYNQFEQIKLTRFATFHFEDAVETIGDLEKKQQEQQKYHESSANTLRRAVSLQEIEELGHKAKRKKCNKCSFAMIRGFMF